jgi:regulator of protease activity HflC (stomatin/prohibitin superfamily)
VPFLDTYDKDIIVTSTLTIPAQSLTTKDGMQVVVKSVVKFNIFDIKPFLLEITDRTDAISDIAQCIIKEQVTQRDWKECSDNELDNLLTKKLRIAVKRWGIDIEKMTLTDIGLIRSIRLFNDTAMVTNT